MPDWCKPLTETDAKRVAAYAIAIIRLGHMPGVTKVELAPMLRVPAGASGSP